MEWRVFDDGIERNRLKSLCILAGLSSRFVFKYLGK